MKKQNWKNNHCSGCKRNSILGDAHYCVTIEHGPEPRIYTNKQIAEFKRLDKPTKKKNKNCC